MKTIIVTLTLVATTVVAFAQGKITIGNDATHLIVSIPGGAISQEGGWDSLTMQLWGGPSAASMYLQTTFVGAAIGNPAFDDGRINNTLFTLLGIPGGATAFLQLRFLDADYGNILSGLSPVFTMVAGSFAPNPIVLPGAPSFSTWTAGDVYAIALIPEPRSMVLASLGVISLLMFHRNS